MKYALFFVFLAYVITLPRAKGQTRVAVGVGAEYAVPFGELSKNHKSAPVFSGSLSYIFDDRSNISLTAGYCKFPIKGTNSGFDPIDITAIAIGYGQPLFNSEKFSYSIAAGYALSTGEFDFGRFVNKNGLIASIGIYYGQLIGRSLAMGIGPSINYAKLGSRNYIWGSFGVAFFIGLVPKNE